MSYKNVLLSIDYSEQTQLILDKGKSVADSKSAKLSLLHVLDNIPMPQVAYGTVIDLMIPTEDQLLEAEKKKFITVADQLNIDRNCRWLIWGNPKQEIIRMANQEQVDLIVIGSHGRHGLALLLGSTANAVLHHAKCDVLAVRVKDF